MATRIVGLDIGTWAVKAVIIELQRELAVVDYREVPLEQFKQESEGDEPNPAAIAAGESVQESDPGGDWVDEEGLEPAVTESLEDSSKSAVAQALAMLSDEGFFEGVTRVIASMPDSKAMTLYVDVPFERKVNVESILPHLLADELPISVSEVVYDFIVVPGKDPGLWEALVGVVGRQELSDFLEEVQAVGVDPAVLGVPELMLRYAGDQAVDPGVESYGILDLGHEFSRLLIMSGGKPVAARTIRTGGAALTEALATGFQLSLQEATALKHQRGRVGPALTEAEGAERRVGQVLEEALRPLLRDLRRTFQSAYATYRVAVDAVYICGGTSRLEGLAEVMARDFQVDIYPLTFDRGLVWEAEADVRGRTPELALAMGSALQVPLDQGESRLITFRQGPFAYRGKSSYLRSQLVRLATVAAVLVVLLAGVLLMQHADQKAQLRAMQAALAEQTEELFGEAVGSPAGVQSRLAGEAGPDRNFVPRMSAYEVMVRLVEQTSPDTPLKLERIEVDMDRSLIQVVGVTNSPQSVDALAAEIGELECLTDVRKDQVNVQGEDQVQFQLQISSGCS